MMKYTLPHTVRTLLVAVMLACSPALSFAELLVTPQPNIFDGVSVISGNEIKADIIKTLRDKGLSNHRIEVNFQSYRNDIPLKQYDKQYRVTLQDFRIMPRSQRFEATYRFAPVSPKLKSENIMIKGTYETFIDVPVLSSPQARGDVVQEDNITTLEISTRDAKRGIITDIADLIGKETKTTIPALKTIRTTQLIEPRIITRNNVVDIIYQTGNIELKTIGTAMSDGSEGEVIDVKNNSSKKVIQAIVIAPNLVRVQSRTTRNYAFNGDF
jgi:flagella basal body P-ring formation protein FlgA